MRLGISSYALAWAIGVPDYPPRSPLDLPAFLRTCSALDVSLVQVADNLALDTLPQPVLHEARALCRDLGLTIQLGLRGLDDQRLARYLTLCRDFDAHLLRAVVDGPGYTPDDASLVALLRASLPALGDAGVVLAIENHDRYTADQLGRIVEAVDSPHVGVCLDTVNSFGALEGPQAVVERLAGHVVNLHVKDFAIARPDHKMGFVIQGAPAGQGRLDLPWLLAALRQAGRAPDVILELWPPPQASVEATIALERAWVAQSLDYLRTFVSASHE